MTNIFFAMLLASLSSIALSAGGFLPIDGNALYKKECALCHGKKGKKIPTGGEAVLVGRDAVGLALEIRAYRDQDRRIGAYTMDKDSQVMKDATSNLSNKEISAIATYINSLK